MSACDVLQTILALYQERVNAPFVLSPSDCQRSCLKCLQWTNFVEARFSLFHMSLNITKHQMISQFTLISYSFWDRDHCQIRVILRKQITCSFLIWISFFQKHHGPQNSQLVPLVNKETVAYLLIFLHKKWQCRGQNYAFSTQFNAWLLMAKLN